jgi:urease accessory protein
MKLSVLKWFLSAILVWSLPLEAHTGTGLIHDFQDGLWHPLLGMDHLLVMTGIGLWAGINEGRVRRYLLPVVILAMAAGATLHFQGAVIPHAEFGVTVSVPALGLILASRRRLPAAWALPIAGGFAILHGFVHASEIGTDAQAQLYISGVMLSTAGLLGLGFAAGQTPPLAVSAIKTVFGLICACTGMVLLLGV